MFGCMTAWAPSLCTAYLGLHISLGEPNQMQKPRALFSEVLVMKSIVYYVVYLALISHTLRSCYHSKNWHTHSRGLEADASAQMRIALTI